VKDKKNGQARTGEARGHQRTAKNTRSTIDTSQVYGISLSAPLTYLKTNESIEQQALQGDILKQMRLHGSNCGNKENELIHWLCHAQRNTTAMGGEMVNVMDDELGLKVTADFKCCNGWQQQFKDREQSVNGEGASVDADSTKQWQEQVTPTNHYAVCSPKGILNLDEAAPCDMQPKRPLALKRQKCHGRKEYKDRVTILCSDADGSENLHSVTVNKFENSYCLKGKRHDSCDYKLSTNVWMAVRLFRENMFLMTG